MSKLYTFVIPFSGTMSVWLEADSEEEARSDVMQGNWWDSNEESFESHPENGMVLVQVEEEEESE
jgi:hypothetical protein